ncbi:MAG: site-2 protease family protein [Chloroflexota bacterium]
MNRNTIPLGRILGIPVGLDPSWFLAFILITWMLASSYFPAEFKNWPVAQYWIVGGVTAVLFFASVLLHELGHSLVAHRYKIPVKSIALFIFGGVAQIEDEPPSAVSEFWVAISGPLVSFALAGMYFLLEIPFSDFVPALAAVRYLAFINGSLALFNLIPGFPLDGGRIFRAFLWSVTKSLRRATLVAVGVGRLIAFGFILFGVWQVLIGNLGNGLWIAFIGWFLENAAVGQAQQQALQDLLAGQVVYQAMRHDCPTIPEGLTLQELVDQHILGRGRRCFVVTGENNQIKGLATLHHIQQVPKSDWATTTASSIMMPTEKIRSVSPTTGLRVALKEMDRDGVNQLPVIEDGVLVGMLTREDVISFVRTRRELGSVI